MTAHSSSSAESTPRSVLYVCNRNSVRSPMAHALTERHCRGRMFVASVGLAAAPLDPFSVAAMREIGIDISDHVPRALADLPQGDFDLVVSLTPEAQHRAVDIVGNSAAAIEYWPTLDPTLAHGNREQKLEAYRQVRDNLARRIESRFARPLAERL